jgi:hypothetical protein
MGTRKQGAAIGQERKFTSAGYLSLKLQLHSETYRGGNSHNSAEVFSLSDCAI